MEYDIEKLKRDIDRTFIYGKELLESEKHKLSDEFLRELPVEKGIYAFYSKNNKIAYIGSATGQKGLYQRISENHLRVSYKEKSVFREAIKSENKIKNEELLVDYIKNNFKISYIDMENKDDSFIKLTELLLIGCFNPKYNKEAKIKN